MKLATIRLQLAAGWRLISTRLFSVGWFPMQPCRVIDKPYQINENK
jgi:hypothetical protein